MRMSSLVVTLLCLASCRPPQEAADFDQQEVSVSPSDSVINDSDSSAVLRSATERFIQSSQSNLQHVDIVWVIDNSGSMEDEQNALVANFDSFIDNFIKDGVVEFPFKMGVTTTEAYRENKDVWRNFDLSSQAAQNDLEKFKEDFKKAVSVGTDGSGTERALWSAYTMAANDPNWFGSEDDLVVYILITDEEEQSHLQSNTHIVANAAALLDENGDQFTIEKWVSKFQTKKSDPKLTLFYPIVAVDVVEKTNHVEGDVDNRFLNLANLSGTTRSDIRKPFDSFLNEISNSIKSTVFRNSYLIQNANTVVGSSVKVYINGQEQIGNWDLSGKTILFDAAPSAGSEVEIKYQYMP